MSSRSTRTLDESLVLVLELFDREDEPDIHVIAREMGLTVGTTSNYLSRAWALHRPGKARPRRGGHRRPRGRERAVEGVLKSNGFQPGDVKRLMERDPEDAEFVALEERLRAIPSNEDLAAALERVNGRRPEQEPAPGSTRLQHAPTFAGLQLSREALVERLARTLCRLAGHRFYDDVSPELQASFEVLAERCVCALEIIEDDLERIKSSAKGAWHRSDRNHGA